MQIWCDGACGETHFAYGFKSEDGREDATVITPEDFFYGDITHHDLKSAGNAAEYMGVISSLIWASPILCHIYCDSKLVVKQVKKEWKINHPHLLFLAMTVRDLLESTSSTLTWIPRDRNRAHRIVEEAIRNGRGSST